MLRTYLLAAWRHLRKYSSYSLLKLIGLGIGITGSVLIFLFVRHELAYDQHFGQSNDIYRLAIAYDFSGQVDQFSNIPRPIAPKMAEDYPQVQAYTRLAGLNGVYTHETMLSYEQTFVKSDQAFYADSSFFQVFDYGLIEGDPQTALKAPNSIVVSEQMAQNLFGSTKVIGKTVSVDNANKMTVTGVMKVTDAPTHMPLNILVSWTTQYQPQEAEQWLGRHVYSYLLLQAGTDAQFLLDQFDAFFGKYMARTFDQLGGTAKLLIQPLSSIHLDSHLNWEAYPNGNRANIYLFSVIALLLLLIAAFNYVNLSLAQSGARALEVGVRKVMGALPGQLFRQFTTESVLISLIALVLGISLTFLLLPQFQLLFGVDFRFPLFSSPFLWLLLLALGLLLGFIAGSYPSIVLSRFSPSTILQGADVKRKSQVRKVLVVGQFIVAIGLLISAMIVTQQIQFMRGKDLGFNQDNLMTLTVKDSSILNNIQSVKNELLSLAAVKSASISSSAPGLALNQTAINVQNQAGETTPFGVQFVEVDHDFIHCMEMQLNSGRFFDRQFPTDTDQSIVINQAAADQFGWKEDAVGKKADFGPNPDGSVDQVQIIGVLSDFHAGSLHNPIEPVILFLEEKQNTPQLLLRLNGTELSQSIQLIEDKWDQFGSAFPFTYTFLDQSLADQYLAEDRLMHLLQAFVFLSILIAVLGLLGLMGLSASKRKREISIRKVLGASTSGLYLLLSQEYLLLVLVANLIAWPLAYWGMTKWLADFAYRIEIGPWPFILTTILSLAVAAITVSYQALQAARHSPITALRHK
ncbi:MAG: ABC transporter permease [Saprospiraceae bacterium]|nr:ABC transporter permease [Saprospiraceae bacterium]